MVSINSQEDINYIASMVATQQYPSSINREKYVPKIAKIDEEYTDDEVHNESSQGEEISSNIKCELGYYETPEFKALEKYA